ncbi:hypothetical protein BC830DRAFT_1173882 [Chytriomyces sp. MP71]|nr:hypothetical protein BC830DRAFT_1173882 [Chytriomyces sp. MP71]
MVSIRSKKRKAARSVKRATVFKPVEDARLDRIAALLHAPKPDPVRPPKTEEDDAAMDKDVAMDEEKSALSKLQREEIMLSRNQFKKRVRARAASKKRIGSTKTAANGAGIMKKKAFKKK